MHWSFVQFDMHNNCSSNFCQCYFFALEPNLYHHETYLADSVRVTLQY